MQSVAPILIFVLGAALGGVAVYLICARLRTSDTDLRSEHARQLENTFKALSADVLRGNGEQFLQLARQELDRTRLQTRVDLDAKQVAIGELVGPIGEALAAYNEKLDAIERARLTLSAQLAQRLDITTATTEQLRAETAALARALNSANVRGTWGEMQLRRVIEFLGMVEHCDFDVQRTLEGNNGNGSGDANPNGSGSVRPDVIVNLPGGRTVLVDAKTPATEFLQAANTDDAEARAMACEGLVDRLRFHVGLLSRKQYWEHLPCTPEFVVLFLPSDAFLGLALQTDPTFFDYCFAQNIVVATPTTLIALLKAVAYVWKQDALAVNAKEISALGRELYDRMCVVGEHLRKVGRSLGASVKAYNEAVGSLEMRVLPSARKFRDLGAAGTRTIPDLRLVESIPTEVTAEELREGAGNGAVADPSSLRSSG